MVPVLDFPFISLIFIYIPKSQNSTQQKWSKNAFEVGKTKVWYDRILSKLFEVKQKLTKQDNFIVKYSLSGDD